MIKHLAVRLRVMNWGQPLRALVIASLLMPVMAIAPAHKADAAQRIQPALLQTVAQHPDSMVGVIVQKTVRDNSVEQSVARLGGTVTRDLSIINAFAAQMPAKAINELNNVPGVRWVSLDAPMQKSVCTDPCMDTSRLASTYPQAVGASSIWNLPGYLQGQGIGVAVVDSGVTTHQDFSNSSGGSRILANAMLSSNSTTVNDMFGHGTHVAGIIAGNGSTSMGRYIGIAPKANIINVKVSDDQDAVMASDVVSGLQWVLNNKATYNIKVVNMSLNSTVDQSYNVDPLDAAVEVLWFNRIVVVVSSGNTGRNSLYPPSNDPFVISVGAVNDMGTATTRDDAVASFSSYGRTIDGFRKPDVMAPGVNIISTLSGDVSRLAIAHTDHRVTGFPGAQYYFRISGTSMAAPMVAGAAALLLQDEPNLNPDQVKYRLMSTTRNISGAGSNAGELDIYAAVTGTSTNTANTGTAASQLLWTGNQPVNWGSVNWGSVNWGSVNWGSVNWGSVNWGSVNWGSDDWSQ